MASKGARRREESQNPLQGHDPTAATTWQTPSTSAIKAKTSRRASLAPAPSPSPSVERSDDATSPQPDKSISKNPRSHVTAIACTPCQNRKSKCDGLRPTCSSCLARGRTDCIYDAAGDQRRTSALKQKIDRLKQENQILKDVIQEVCTAQDTRSAVEIVRRVSVNDFQGFEDVAALLKRRQNTSDDTVGAKAPSEARAGRNSAEESMEIDAATPQDVNINPVLTPVNTTTHGAPIPFLPPASLDTAANLSCKGQAPAVHIKSPACQDAGRSGGSLSVSSPSTPSFTYATKPRHDVLSTAPLISGSGAFYSNTSASSDQQSQSSWRYLHPESPYCPSVLWIGRAFGVPEGENQTGRDQVKSALMPVPSLQPFDMEEADPFTSHVAHFIQKKRDLLAFPLGWRSEHVVGNTGDVVDAQLLYLMEGRILAPSEDPTVTQFAASVLGQMSFPGPAERLAMFYLMVNFLNWRILPDVQSHNVIPNCLKPTAEQSLVPHPAWVDYLPWPRLRNEFISRPDLARRGNALSALSQYTRVNWPSEYALAYDYRAQDRGMNDLGTSLERLSDAFKDHVANVNSWSLDSRGASLYCDIVFVDKVWIQPDCI